MGNTIEIAKRSKALRFNVAAHTMGMIGVVLLVMVAATACTSTPPLEIRQAISVMNDVMPEYVKSANAALESSGDQDGERLMGNGTRLEQLVKLLHRWASGEAQQ